MTDDKISIIFVAVLFMVGAFSYKLINQPEQYSTGFSLTSPSYSSYKRNSSDNIPLHF